MVQKKKTEDIQDIQGVTIFEEDNPTRLRYHDQETSQSYSSEHCSESQRYICHILHLWHTMETKWNRIDMWWCVKHENYGHMWCHMWCHIWYHMAIWISRWSIVGCLIQNTWATHPSQFPGSATMPSSSSLQGVVTLCCISLWWKVVCLPWLSSWDLT